MFSLSKNWYIQSSEKINCTGSKISSSEYSYKSWYPTDVPSTVIQTLAKNQIIPNPYFSLNMKNLAGYKGEYEDHLANIDKPLDSPYRQSWWYRNEFQIPKELQKGDLWFDIEGINYRANIWLNGKRIAGQDHIIGTYRTYSINISNHIIKDSKNVVAFEIFSPQADDLAMSWIDWCPTPPDDNMGIWRPIFLRTSGPVSLISAFINPRLNVNNLKEAEIEIAITLKNSRKEMQQISLLIKIEDIDIQIQENLNSWETKTIILSEKNYPMLILDNPRIWWPYELGRPEMYECYLELTSLNSEEHFQEFKTIPFGIRDIKSYVNEYGSRQFEINGEPLFLRAIAWTPDIFLQNSITQDEIDISFVKNLNLNSIRFEGKFAMQHFWDLCDKEGILILAGWPCCNHWEKWENWKPGDLVIAKESIRSQLLNFRNHPSLAAWFYGSDFPPPGWVEKEYLQILDELCPQLPRISSAADKKSEIQGESGVKMSGPYSYVSPDYWYNSNRPGWGDSFNTETSPDVCIPTLDSITKFLPEKELLIGSEGWNFHCGTPPFNNTRLVQKSLQKRYGKSTSLSEFISISQIAGYDGWRAMYEAYARNFPRATGIVGWMLNSPWPSLIWQLYDVYNNPNGSYFGVQKACEAVHVQYSYDDHSIWAINRTSEEYSNCMLKIKIFDHSLKEIQNNSQFCEINQYSRVKIGQIPDSSKFKEIYFVFLVLQYEKIILSQNYYLLTPFLPVYSGKDTFYHSVIKQAGNMKSLSKIPQISTQDIQCKTISTNTNKNLIIEIEIVNDSSFLAFFVRFDLVTKDMHSLIAPVLWSENDISILGKSQRIIKVQLSKNLKDKPLQIRISGNNLSEILYIKL